MTRPKLLDLFCGGGGAAMGYYRAGFEVVGVDIEPQKHYPFTFVQSDALEYVAGHGAEFDALHASPPCQAYSVGTKWRRNLGASYPDLLSKTQQALYSIGKPFIIENVPGATKILKSVIMLCGGMFGIGVVRHRFFETSFMVLSPPHTCNRSFVDSDLVSMTKHGPPARWYKRNPGKSFTVKTWHDAIGIDWMPRDSLRQAIPPAYTEFIGACLMQFILCEGN